MVKENYADDTLNDSIVSTEEDDGSQPSKCLKYRALISAMLINILIGSYYVYGNINEYCANFMGVDKQQTLFIQPLWLFIQGGGVVFSIRLCEKFGYRMVNFWSFFIYILTNLACAWIKNVWLFFLDFGVISGIVVGFGYLPSLYIAWTYFPESKSMTTGAILFFAGLSTLILAPLTTAIVNPNDLDSSDPEVTKRVPLMWYVISGLYTVIFAISAALQPAPWDPEAARKQHLIMKETLATKSQSNTNKKDDNLEVLLDKVNNSGKSLSFNNPDEEINRDDEKNLGVQGKNSLDKFKQSLRKVQTIPIIENRTPKASMPEDAGDLARQEGSYN